MNNMSLNNTQISDNQLLIDQPSSPAKLNPVLSKQKKKASQEDNEDLSARLNALMPSPTRPQRQSTLMQPGSMQESPINNKYGTGTKRNENSRGQKQTHKPSQKPQGKQIELTINTTAKKDNYQDILKDLHSPQSVSIQDDSEVTDNKSIDNSDGNIHANIEKKFETEKPKKVFKTESMKNIYLSRGDIEYSDNDSQDGRTNTNRSRAGIDSDRSSLGSHSRAVIPKGKDGINFLKAQEQFLNEQILKNKHLMELEKQKAAFGNNMENELKPNVRFKNFNDIFSSLTKQKNVVTMYPIQTCIITYNSKSVITVTKKNDREYYVKQYSLEAYNMTFEEKVGGGENDYIKLKEVEQNSSGTQFAIVYMNDGVFYIRTFGTQNRSEEEIKKNEFNINQALQLDNYTMPIQNFPDPYITCTWVNNNLIFVNLFHNHQLMHFHFFFNISSRKVSQLTKIKLDSNSKNFPYKCFYNADLNQIYSFYRQCQSFRIPVKDVEHPMNKLWNDELPYAFQKIHDRDLGTMFLINNTALVARCSSQILFFKIMIDDFTKETTWVNYKTLDIRGFLYFIKGNKRIQITTDQYVYFFLIDPKTFEPILENVMFNFMSCSQMMFGSRVRYCVTYKTNQRSFDIYRRKYEHNFMVNAKSQNCDGAIGISVESMNAFIVTETKTLKFYNVDTFKEILESRIDIPLLDSVTREPNQIISVRINKKEDYLAVMSGKNLIMNEQFPNQLFIFRKNKSTNTDEPETFSLVKRILIKDRPDFKKISMQFSFKRTRNGGDPTKLIFARQDAMIELNLETEQSRVILVYEVPLTMQPEFFLTNHDQTISIIASQDDGIYYNHRTKVQVDLDEAYHISNIKEVIHDEEDKMFYMLCNKYDEKLGIFLVKFSEVDPTDHQFILRWKNKLDIDDCSVNIIRNQAKRFKELVICFKTIFINTYNVQIIDISQDTNQTTIFRHESFQLWESRIRGFYLSKNKDFVTVNRDGINVLSLNPVDKRSITDELSQEKMIHSLGSANYLKVDKKNFILFEFATDINVISIMQQYTANKHDGEETNFECIYKIRIHDITLRELLLFQSLYVCKTQSDIVKLVGMQPHPAVFYKSFFELDGTNMVSILSFDSRSLKVLLDDNNNEYFQQQYPIFYKNKIKKTNNKDKYFYRSPIDSALRNNQIRAVGYIIDYVCKYQNNFTSSYMFTRNIPILIQKGVEVSPLFNSKIFSFTFDFDEWPSTHSDSKSYMVDYNESIFDLRSNYYHSFGDMIPDDEAVVSEDIIQDTSKMYKVKYQMNMLSMIEKYAIEIGHNQYEFQNPDICFMELIVDANQLDIFESENVENLINYKWNKFAQKLHIKGFIFHFIYLTVMAVYVNKIYVDNDIENKQIYCILLGLSILYPTWYDIFQMYKLGPRYYFSDSTNYNNLVYTLAGISNVFIQSYGEPQHILQKCFTCFLLLQQLLKSFFYLRVFGQFSYIVTMINRVIQDLQIFMVFLFLLLFVFGMIVCVIGVGNPKIPGSGFEQYWNDLEKHNDEERDMLEAAYGEYDMIGIFIGNIFAVLRMSLGDFDFNASEHLSFGENILYWITVFLVIMMTCIVFLNFIIAEVSNSYQRIKQRINAFVNKEKASLISEAEHMTFNKYKDNKMFPKYIIIRQIEH